MWHNIIGRILFSTLKPTLRRHRKRLINELTKGHLDPLQQLFLNAIISQIIDVFIVEETSTGFIEGQYEEYVHKLKLARTLMAAIFGIANIIEYHVGGKHVIMKKDKSEKRIMVDDFKNRLIDNVDDVINKMQIVTGASVDSIVVNADVELLADDIISGLMENIEV